MHTGHSPIMADRQLHDWSKSGTSHYIRMLLTNKSERSLPDVRSGALSYSDSNLFLGIQSARKVFRLDIYLKSLLNGVLCTERHVH